MTVLTDQERIARLEHVVRTLVSWLHGSVLDTKRATELIRELHPEIPESGLKPPPEVKP